MNFGNLVGQTLDEKYKIERELGEGGMGAVYLATHIGTERPVAVKVIVPQFMQRTEFVERFRREAKAAGRLRHPNVVDVTDFGFDETPDGRVAYLVMEYLDGCTLGEILEEEERLPLAWTLDILEQVCSAVTEAHRQGIIHRDLKPDNIWLEPNQRGGYTVKVLDFGIAKLETPTGEDSGNFSAENLIGRDFPTREISAGQTFSDRTNAATLIGNQNLTLAPEGETIADNKRTQIISNEAATLVQDSGEIDGEGKTAILPVDNEGKTISLEDRAETKLMSAPFPTGKSAERELTTDKSRLEKRNTNELTRVGAVLGTPLYMSPEQCGGEKLTAQSDIYSLGVIAYQMLNGKTPFDGSFTDVMQAHKDTEPPELKVKKVPQKVKKVIMSALSKNPADRPATAEAFASKLRAHSEGFGTLLQRALAIYGQHLPKFLWLAILIYLPITIITLLQVFFNFLSVSELASKTVTNVTLGVLGLTSGFFGIFCAYLLLGTVAWIVTQHLAVPLRPISLKTAFNVARSRWRTFAGTGLIVVVLTLIGYVLCVLPGLYLGVMWALVAPVIMMEGLRGRAALRRSKQLTRRSLKTTAAAVFTMFLIPVVLSSLMAFSVNAIIKSFEPAQNEPAAVEKQQEQSGVQLPAQENQPNSTAAAENRETDDDIDVNFGRQGINVKFTDDKKDMRSRVRKTIRDALIQILWLPIQILFSSFSGIIIALLYLKTRQAGGESMQDLLKQFEDADRPQSRWQERVQKRLLQSGRITGRT